MESLAPTRIGTITSPTSPGATVAVTECVVVLVLDGHKRAPARRAPSAAAQQVAQSGGVTSARALPTFPIMRSSAMPDT